MRYVRDAIISAADASVGQNSIVVDANQLISISLQAVVAGTSAGALKLQFSDDFALLNQANAQPTHWSDIPSATVAVAGAGVYGIPKFDLCYRWIRAVYTPSSGTGTITANMNALSF